TRELLARKEDGRIKLYVTYRALHCRREDPRLFTIGEYLPVEAAGPRQEHVFGFVRRHEKQCAAVIVPRLLTGLLPSPEKWPPPGEIWQDTVLPLSIVEAKRRWRDVFTGEIVPADARSGQTAVRLADVFANLPVALLIAEG